MNHLNFMRFPPQWRLFCFYKKLYLKLMMLMWMFILISNNSPLSDCINNLLTSRLFVLDCPGLQYHHYCSSLLSPLSSQTTQSNRFLQSGSVFSSPKRNIITEGSRQSRKKLFLLKPEMSSPDSFFKSCHLLSAKKDIS